MSLAPYMQSECTYAEGNLASGVDAPNEDEIELPEPDPECQVDYGFGKRDYRPWEGMGEGV